MTLTPVPPPIINRITLRRLGNMINTTPLSINKIHKCRHKSCHKRRNILKRQLLRRTLKRIRYASITRLTTLPRIRTSRAPMCITTLRGILTQFRNISRMILRMPLHQNLPRSTAYNLLKDLTRTIRINRHLGNTHLSTLNLNPNTLLLTTLPTYNPPLLQIREERPTQLTV